MNCREFEDKVAAYIEGALSGEPLREMESHRASCPKCARLAELHQVMFAALNDTQPVHAPRGLADRIFAAAEAEESVPATGNIVPFPQKRSLAAIDCETFERLVAAFVDGALAGDEERQMARHRQTCAACAKVAAVHETVAAALDNAEPLRAPAHLTERIFAAAVAEEVAGEMENAVKVRIRLFERFGAALAGAGALVAAMVLLTGAVLPKFSVVDWVYAAQGRLFAAFPMLEAWLVSVLPAQWIVRLQAITAPVSVPYVSVSVPVYYFAPLLMLAAAMMYYLHHTSADTAEVELF